MRLGERVRVPRWAIGIGLLVILALGTWLWSVKSREQAHVRPAYGGSFRDALPSIAALTEGALIDGNRVEVLQDEALFDDLLASIDRAERSVTFETFVWWEGEIGRRLAAAFVAAAARGAEVKVLVDAVGGRRMEEEVALLMRTGGVELVRYHELSFVELDQYDNRDHRKIAVVDGRIGYAFGHGVAREWTAEARSGPEPHPPWRDTGLRVEGPLVASLQSVFMENWMEEADEVPYGEAFFPHLEPAGRVTGHVVRSSPHGTVSSVELLYKLAIATAQHEILVQNPYFVPDDDVVALLVEAAERGVAVRLMVPGEGTDNPVVLHAGHTLYEPLLAAGVEIWEYRPTLLHQKVMVVDGVWSHVGSTNFDARSLEINDEVSLGIVDERIGQALRTAFLQDREHAARIGRSWRRSWGHRLLDRLAFQLHEQI